MYQKKLSIIFVTNNYTPYQGGVVSSITTSVEALRKKGHSVTIITLDFVHQNNYEPGVIRLYCPFKFTYKTNPMAIPWFPSYQIEKLLYEIKPDIIHVHHPFLLGKAALQASKNLKIPLIYTYHTLYDHYLHYIPLPQIITRAFVNKLIQSFCKNVHGIIAPSNAVKERLNNRLISTKTEIIPSAIASIFFQKIGSKKHAIPFQLLSVSRFAKEKNIYFLLDVVALLNSNNFILTLAGHGAEFNALRDYAYVKKKLSPNTVIFLEKPTKQQLVNLYQQAHLFIFGSTSETQGLVLAEAMAQGTPVITMDGPGQRDIIENAVNGFIVKNQYEMKERIEECFNNQALYSLLQENARKTAQNYSMEYLTDKLINFYYTVITK